MAGVGNGRRGETEVATLVVGQDVELIAVLIDRVLVTLLTCRNEFRRRHHVRGRDIAPLVRIGTRRANHDVFPAARPSCVQAVEFIFFFRDQHILICGFAQGMTPELVRTFGRVFTTVEQSLVVGRPESINDLAELIREFFSGPEVFDVKDVIAVPVVVH